MDKNYSIIEIGTFKEDLANKKRIMVGQELDLTGSEISFNHTPAGGFTPFAHSHKLNEEVYIILSGNGMFMVDGDEFPIKEGSIIRIEKVEPVSYSKTGNLRIHSGAPELIYYRRNRPWQDLSRLCFGMEACKQYYNTSTFVFLIC